MARRGLDHTLELVEGGGRPDDEQRGVHQRRKGETRRPLDTFVQQQRGAAAGLRDEARAPRVGRDERGLGGRQRHVVVAVGEEAVHAERSGEADRDLHRADVAFDVARVAFGLLEGTRVGELATRADRQAREAPSALDGLGAAVAGGRDLRRGRIVAGHQARELRGVAPGGHILQEVDDAP